MARTPGTALARRPLRYTSPTILVIDNVGDPSYDGGELGQCCMHKNRSGFHDAVAYGRRRSNSVFTTR